MRCLSILTACAGLANAIPTLSARQGSSDNNDIQKICNERGWGTECAEFKDKCEWSGWRANLLPDCLRVIGKVCKKNSDCGERFECSIIGFTANEGDCMPVETLEGEAERNKTNEDIKQREREEEQEQKEENQKKKEKEQKKKEEEQKKKDEEEKQRQKEIHDRLTPEIRAICKERGWKDEVCDHQRNICNEVGWVSDQLPKCLKVIIKECNQNSDCGAGFKCIRGPHGTATCSIQGPPPQTLDEQDVQEPKQEPKQKEDEDTKIQAICKERGWKDEGCDHQRNVCNEVGWVSDQLPKCLKVIIKECNQNSDCGEGFKCFRGSSHRTAVCSIQGPPPQALEQQDVQEPKQNDEATKQQELTPEIRAICKERGWNDAACNHQKGMCDKAGWGSDRLLECLKSNMKACKQDSDCTAGFKCFIEPAHPATRLGSCEVQWTPEAVAERKKAEEAELQRQREEEEKRKEDEKMQAVCNEYRLLNEACLAAKTACRENGRVTGGEMRHCIINYQRDCRQNVDCGDGFTCSNEGKLQICKIAPLQKPQQPQDEQEPKRKEDKTEADYLKELGPMQTICKERQLRSFEVCAFYKEECQQTGRVTDEEISTCLRINSEVCKNNSECGDGFECEDFGSSKICRVRPLQKPQQQRDEQGAMLRQKDEQTAKPVCKRHE